MKLRFIALGLRFRRSFEVIPFSDVTFLSGPNGVGKSSIARLIDFCLGGDYEKTPALQREFVSAELSLCIEDIPLRITRSPGSASVSASWITSDGPFDLILPAREAAGEVLQGTGVAVLSDLIFHLAGIQPPMVRRGKTDPDSPLIRLSLRRLLWYSYLRQDEMDSTFFRLDKEKGEFRANHSKDALRYLLGFHQQRVAELEFTLEQLRRTRSALEAAAGIVMEVLLEADVASEADIASEIEELELTRESLNRELQTVRESFREQIHHAAEPLRDRGRSLAGEIASIRSAITAINEQVLANTRHKNELIVLGLKVRRAESARAVLNGVEFQHCPRCAQELLQREPGQCLVCGQEESLADNKIRDIDCIESDRLNRISELEEIIRARGAELRRQNLDLSKAEAEKIRIDAALEEAISDYDTAYTSRLVASEREKGVVEERIRQLEKLKLLPHEAALRLKKADGIRAQEAAVRRELGSLRQLAEKDTTNLRELGRLFLDYLVRSKVAGISPEDEVVIEAPNFLPRVYERGNKDVASTAYGNLGSGGKKTLFKCCFALALHRLARELGAPIPNFIIIDTPMKNISERQNREQYESFYELLYSLAENELCETQFIIIDKEFRPPERGMPSRGFAHRYMTLGDPRYPPLIPYLRLPGSDAQIQDDVESESDDSD